MERGGELRCSQIVMRRDDKVSAGGTKDDRPPGWSCVAEPGVDEEKNLFRAAADYRAAFSEALSTDAFLFAALAPRNVFGREVRISSLCTQRSAKNAPRWATLNRAPYVAALEMKTDPVPPGLDWLTTLTLGSRRGAFIVRASGTPNCRQCGSSSRNQ